jgi:periplasmic protein TonB
LIASLLLHVILFALRAPQYEVPPSSTPPIDARIVQAPVAAEPKSPVHSLSSPPPKQVRKSEKPSSPKRLDPAVAEPKASASPAPTEIAPQNPTSATRDSVNTTVATSNAEISTGDTTAASAPSAIADPGAIARYRISLMSVAERYKRFPEYARDREWQGRSDWHVEVGADGRLRELRLKKSSGYEVLDRTAGEMLRSAQPETPLPPDLQGRSFSFAVGVIFNFGEREPTR